jgi:hypothetical protein
VEEFHSDLESDSEETLRGTIKRKMAIGVIMSVALLLLPIVLFLVQNSLPTIALTLLLIAFSMIGLLGTLICLYYGMGSSMLFRGEDILRKIAPPEPFIEGKLAVLNKNPVYIIIPWGSNALLFVAFFQSERTFDQKVKLPRVIWTWEYTNPIGDIKVARRENTFTIPVDKGIYYTGEGVLYSLLLEKTGIIAVPKTFTAEQLNRIVDSLAQEIVTYGSSRQLDNDDFE